MPRNRTALVDVTFEYEQYDGFWNQDGDHVEDPSGSDLRQYRVNLGYAHRLATDWQAGVLLPYVWNVNEYSGTASRSQGLGDSSVSLWYEAVDDRSIWKLQTWRDYVPSITIGASLLLPTGISPYDDVDSSFDVTGRGFYRLDGTVVLDKTYIPWNVSTTLSYGAYFERPVNREYGKYVDPYDKKLGDRFAASASLSYKYFVGTGGDALAGAVSMSYLQEEDGTIDGHRDPTSGFRKTAIGGLLTYSSTDHDWSVRGGWTHALQRDGWGQNFPTTDVFSLGVRYVFR